jgi:tripartite-type tricarboxylate transporter receptor subunit TctC
LTYASAGYGCPGHLAAALLELMMDIRMTHIPYNGATSVFADLLSGQVNLSVTGIPPAISFIKSGKLRALAVTTATRTPALPDVPTLAESGVAGYDVPLWFGIIAPRGVPDAIVQKLHNDIASVSQMNGTREKLAAQGINAVSDSSEEFAELIRKEAKQWGGLASKIHNL